MTFFDAILAEKSAYSRIVFTLRLRYCVNTDFVRQIKIGNDLANDDQDNKQTLTYVP